MRCLSRRSGNLLHVDVEADVLFELLQAEHISMTALKWRESRCMFYSSPRKNTRVATSAHTAVPDHPAHHPAGSAEEDAFTPISANPASRPRGAACRPVPAFALIGFSRRRRVLQCQRRATRRPLRLVVSATAHWVLHSVVSGGDLRIEFRPAVPGAGQEAGAVLPYLPSRKQATSPFDAFAGEWSKKRRQSDPSFLWKVLRAGPRTISRRNCYSVSSARFSSNLPCDFCQARPSYACAPADHEQKLHGTFLRR